MTSHPAHPTSDGGDSRDHLQTLAFALQVHEFEVDSSADLLRVTTPTRPGFALEIRCHPRAADEGRLWFFGPDGEPISEANNFSDAMAAIKGLFIP